MLLHSLFKQILPSFEVSKLNASQDAVLGITCDSREVKPGTLFFALPGTNEHGNKYIDMALDKGAIAIVSNATPNVAYEGQLVVVDHVRTLYAQSCALFYQPQPTTAVAVTGTNGKTSVVNFVQQFWQMAGISGAALGTVGLKTSAGLLEGTLTSPEPSRLHQTFQELAKENITHIALEASSHGMDQRRFEGVDISVAGYTNFSRDHLDYHPTEQAYFDAKKRLFDGVMSNNGTAIVHMDDARSKEIVAACEKRNIQVHTVGRVGQDIKLLEATPNSSGIKAKVEWHGEMIEFTLSLMGAFQLDNVLVALGMAEASGVDKQKLLAILPNLQGVKGRLEQVANYHGAKIFVDYAHTPEAIETALKNLRAHTSSNLYIVFGAGGDRDPGKRKLMGEAATQYADYVIVTDDNPRTEDPATIRTAIMSAVPDGHEIGDRAKAIKYAMDHASKDDIILIAGKGHEAYQIIGNEKTYFSDHDEVLSYAAREA